MSVQISAYIEDDIKLRMEDYSSKTGIKKGFIIQNALNYYLNAVNDIPINQIVPTDVILSQDEFKRLEQLDKKEPTDELKELLS